MENLEENKKENNQEIDAKQVSSLAHFESEEKTEESSAGNASFLEKIREMEMQLPLGPFSFLKKDVENPKKVFLALDQKVRESTEGIELNPMYLYQSLDQKLRQSTAGIELNPLKYTHKKPIIGGIIIILLLVSGITYKIIKNQPEIPKEIVDVAPYDHKIDKTDEGYSIDFSKIRIPQEDINVGQIASSKIKKVSSIKKDGDTIKTTPEIVTNVVYGGRGVHFEEAKISLKKTDKVNAIIQCENWNEKNNQCDSEWVLAYDIAFNQTDDKIEFTVKHFSAYAGAYLNVLNIASNPMQGETWTVNFQTYGQSDLVVAAVDGTHRGTDIAFQSISCGDTQIDNSLVIQNGDTITVKNYQCDGQVSNIKNTAVTGGRHWQSFTFGDTVGALTHNWACNTGDFNAGNTCVINQSYTISNGDVIGTGGAGSTIQISSGATLTTTAGNSFTIDNPNGTVIIDSGASIVGNVTINATTLTINGTIVADGKGYTANNGTGTGGIFNTYYGGGGGYGGNGGYALAHNDGGVTYGSAIAPVSFGSGGGATGGGSGGGAVKIAVTGTTTINGTISVNGSAGNNSGSYYGGGGSGGSVWIDTDTLAGTASITANGGDGLGVYTSGAGGGGRIAITYNSISSGTLTKNAYGGTNTSTPGGAGTIFTKDKDGQTNGDLLIDNSTYNGANTTQIAVNYTFDNVTIQSYGKYVILAGYSLTPTTIAGNTTGSLIINGTLDYSGTAISNIGIITNNGTMNIPNLTTISSVTTFNNNTVLASSVLATISGVTTFNNSGTISGTTDLTITGYSTFNQTGTFSDLTDLTIGGSGTTTFSYNKNTNWSFTNLTINSGGILTHAASSSKIDFTLLGNLTINSGGSINVDGKGYAAGNGSGAGTSDYYNDYGGGGGYGGNGGYSNGSTTNGGIAYGLVDAPTDLGSGGASAHSAQGGAGGGAVKIAVTGTAVINGNISANGGSGSSYYSSYYGGGGSGGSIWIDTGTLAGTASITANGGNGVDYSGYIRGGGGGGGRIAVTYNSISGGTLTKNAYGGTTAYQPGGAGTIFTKDKDGQTNGDLLVDNSTYDGALTTQINASDVFDTVTIQNYGKYIIPSGYSLGATVLSGNGAGNSVINNGTLNLLATATISGIAGFNNAGTISGVTNLTVTGTTAFTHSGTIPSLTDLTIGGSGTTSFLYNKPDAWSLANLTIGSGGTLIHAANTTTKVYSIDLTLSGNLTIDSGGSINANGKGFTGGNGLGTGSNYNSGSYYYGGGAGYGGNGGYGYGSTTSGGIPYGAVDAPTDLGSGGANAGGGSGGGLVKISVNSGTATINGSVSSNGANGGYYGSGSNSYYGGGGSGGSVWIDANILAGSGTIAANGGSGYSNSIGAGGGGRIALTYNSISSGALIKQTYGGVVGSQKGGAGTIYTKNKSSQTNGDLLIDNSTYSNSANTTQYNVSDTFDTVTIQNYGKYVIPVGYSLNAATLTGNKMGENLINNGTLNVSGTTISNLATITNAGTLNAANLTTISAVTNFNNSGSINGSTDLTISGATTFNITAALSSQMNLIVESGATLSSNTTANSSIGSLTIKSGGTLTHLANSSYTKAYLIDFTLSGNLTVESGGTINVDGKGFSAAGGPGSGGTYFNGVSTYRGAGGGYGGNGTTAGTIAGGVTYGSPTAPTDLGSGGGNGGSTAGSAGGGAVKIVVSGTTTINGNISANGAASNPCDYWGYNIGGAGSGGSVWIDTGILAGTASITASGGTGVTIGINGGYSYSGGAGGGGRIALTYNSISSGALTKQAYGGSGAYSSSYAFGGAGTIYTKNKSSQTNGDLLIDNSIITNSSYNGANTTQTAANFTFDTVSVQSYGKYVIPAGYSLTAATLTGNTTGSSLTNNGTLDFSGTTISNIASITNAGTISAPDLTTISNIASITNSGTISAPNLTTFSNITAFNNTSTLSLTGFTTLSGVTTFNNSGTLTLPATATISAVGFTNSGTISGTTDLTITGYSTFNQTGTFSDLTNLIIGGSSVTTFNYNKNTNWSFANLTINSGGVLSHAANSTTALGKQYAIDFTLSGNLTVNSGGTINTDGKGFTGGNGPGTGLVAKGLSSSGSFGSGAGYGGNGGAYSTAAGGVTYGSLIEPTDLGSGGGGGYGGAGGGAVKIAAAGTVTINGTISANGNIGTGTGYWDEGGGGSGGSIWISTTGELIAGTNSITAMGGAGALTDNYAASAGGGGRIAVTYNSISSGTLTRAAYSGATGYQKGGAGTIYTKSASQTNGDLLVDNSTYNGADTTQIAANYTFDSVTINNYGKYIIPSGYSLGATVLSGNGIGNSVTNNGTLNLPATATISAIATFNNPGTISGVTNLTVTGTSIFNNSGILPNLGNLTIGSGATFSYNKPDALLLANLTIDSGGTLTHGANSTTALGKQYVLDFTLSGNLTVASGGSINANGKGFTGGNGSGTGGSYAYSSSTFGGGGGYGGNGGYSAYTSTNGGITYGAVDAPNDLGSGGGLAVGGAGGGIVKMTVAGTTAIDGTMSVNGSVASGAGGGGAGGSVYINTATLSGSGTISANGGTGGAGGGGGGGRIALIYNSISSGTLTNTAYGGTSSYQAGGAGTIYTKSTSQTNGDLLIRNSTYDGASTTQIANNYAFNSVTIQNYGKYVIPSGYSLTNAGDIIGNSNVTGTLTNNGTLNISGTTISNLGTVNNVGTLTGANLTTISAVTTFTNSGTLTAASTATISGTLGTTVFNNSGTLSGITNLTVTGTIAFSHTGTMSNLTDLTIGGSGTTTFNYNKSTNWSFTNLTINSGGTLSHSANGISKTYAIDFALSGNLTVNSGGAINVDAKGFQALSGSGAGSTIITGSNYYGSGAGYGGVGGYSSGSTTNGGLTYGSALKPNDLGSGGGATGGKGGGSVKIIVAMTGTATLNGAISANGGVGTISGSSYGGGGSGGSVWIGAGTLTGGGAISANGGNSASTTYAGGGGGGRIALYANTSTGYTGTRTVTGGTGLQAGSSGTSIFDATTPVLATNAVCSTAGNSCTTAGAAASTQRAYVIASIGGTSQDSESGVNDLTLSIQDVTANVYYNGSSAFDQSSEYWITPTISPTLPTSSAITWSYSTASIPFTLKHVYAVKVKAQNGYHASVVTTQIMFVNTPPTVSSVTASQNDTTGLVSVTYGASDTVSSSTTIRLAYLTDATLVGSLDATSTADIALSSVALLPSSGYLVLDDDEIIQYTDKSTVNNTLTGITRGALNTEGVVHADGSPAYIIANAVTGDVGTSVSNGTGKTLVWTPKTDIDGLYNASYTVKVISNDGDQYSMVGKNTSNTFEFDAKDPVVAVNIDGSAQYGTNPSNVYISLTDDTMTAGTKGTMMYSLSSDFSGASYTTYNTTTTAMLDSSGDTDTLYWKFRDSKNNITSGSTTLPNKPPHCMVQDTSNLLLETPLYALLSAWGIINPPVSGTFLHYNILRSTVDDDAQYVKVNNTFDAATDLNYYNDINDLTKDINYYYKITAEDSNHNISFRPVSTWGKANGTQDAGEGGGGVKTKPAISNVQVSSIGGMQAVITWDTDELSNSTVGYSTTPGVFSSTESSAAMTNNAGTTGVGQHRVVLKNLTPNSTYYFRVSSKGAGGVAAVDANEANNNEGYTFTTLDGPVISKVVAYPVRNTQATITWETDINSDSNVTYSLNANMSDSTTVSVSESVLNHSVTIKDLTSDTTYYFYVKSGATVDDNGTSYYSFTTTSDTVSPEITFDPGTGITNVTDTKASISWNTNKATNAKVVYGTATGSYPLSSENTSFDYDHRINLTGLSMNTTYYFKLESTDENSNSATSSEYSFTTQITADTTGPVISDVTITNTAPTTATITWTTDEESSSFIQYATTETDFSNIYKEFGRGEDAVTAHSVTLEGLSQATKNYYFKVKSIDAAGNSTTDIIRTLTLADGPAINTVTVTPDLTSAVFTWTTSANSDAFVVYSINSNFFNAEEKGVSDKTTTSHSVTLTGLTSGVTYYYKIRSTGTDNGVTTKESASQYFATTTDTTAPVISSISTEAVAYDSAVIKWITDENATSQVEYGTEQGNLSSSTTLDPNFNIDHAVVLTGLSASTKYYFKVISTDGSGNTSSDNSASNYFTTAKGLAYQHDPLAAITDVTNSFVTDSSAIITFNTDQEAVCAIDYGTATGVYDQTTPVETEYSMGHSVNISGLSVSTGYFYKITCTDNLGTTITTPTEYTFTTIASQVSHISLSKTVHDTDPTVIMETDTEAMITFNAGTDTISALCKSTTANIDMSTCTPETPAVTGKSIHSYYLSGLDAKTTYYIKMKLTDSINAADTYTTGEVSFTTLPIQSGHVPLSKAAHDTSPTVMAKTDTEAMVIFNAATTSSSKLCLATVAGIDMDVCTAVLPELTNSEIHYYHLTGLTAATGYYLKMKIVDSDEPATEIYITEETPFVTNEGPEYQHDPLSSITDITTSLVTDKNAVISFTTDQKAICTVNYGTATGVYGQMNSDETEYNTGHAITLSGLNISADYFYTITCTDNLTNSVNAAEHSFTTLAEQIGHTPLSGSLHSNVPTVTMETDTEALITFDAGTTVNSKICISTSTGIDINTCTEAMASVTNKKIHTYHLTGLTPYTMQYVKMKVTDSIDASDTYTTDEISFQTLPIQLNHVLLSVAAHDTMPTIIMKTDTEAAITFDAGTTATSKLCEATTSGIDIDTCQGIMPTVINKKIHSYHITGLTADTTYYLKMKLTDSDDSSDIYNTEEVSFTTEKSSEFQHDPLSAITDVSASLLTDTNAVITFNTDQEATCVIKYGTVTGVYSQTTPSETEYNKSHSINISNLSASTAYYYKIICTDNLNTSVTTSNPIEYTFTTLAAQVGHTPLAEATHDTNPTVTMETDTEAMITFNAGTAASSKICIATEAGINADTCTQVMANISNKKIHSYHLAGLTADTTYYVKMRITDSVDNTDTYITEEVSFKTLVVQSGHTPLNKATHDTIPTVITKTTTEAMLVFDSATTASSKLCYATTAGIDIDTCTAVTPVVVNSEIHYYHLTGLTAGTGYYLKMKLVDTIDSSDTYITEETYFITVEDPEYQHDPISAITDVTESIVTDVNAVISFNTDQSAKCIVYNGTEPTFYVGENGSGNYTESIIESEYSKNHAINITGLTASTIYYYQISCTDNLLNVVMKDSSAGYSFTTLQKQVGHTPLSSATHDTNPTVTLQTDTEAMVTFNAGTETVAKLCKSTTSNINMSTCTEETPEVNSRKIHSYQLSNLTPNTTYYIKMKLTDSVDNADTYTTGEVSFDTLPVQTSHVALSSAAHDIGPSVIMKTETEAVIIFNAATTANSKLCYATISGINVDACTEVTPAVTGKQIHSYHLSGLTAGTTYYVKMKLTDAEDSNDTYTTTETSFTTDVSAEFQHDPLSSIANVMSTLITDSNAIITFDTDQKATCVIDYGTTSGSYPLNNAVETKYNEKHSINLSDLTVSTKYYYKITCTDNLNSTVTDATEYSFTTLAKQTSHNPLSAVAHDVDPTVSSQTDTEAMITFNAGTTATSKLCVATTSGVDIAACTAITPVVTNNRIHAYHLTGLTPNTTYYLKMKLTDSVDAADTYITGEVSLTTLAVQSSHVSLANATHDTVPNVLMKSQTEAVITFNAGTTASSKLCKATISEIDINSCIAETPAITDNEIHSYHLTGLTAGTRYYLKMKLTDSEDAADIYVSTEVSFTTDENPEYQHAALTVINNIATSLITDTNTVVTFNTDQDAICMARNTNLSGSYDDALIFQEDGYTSKENYSKQHSIPFTGLLFDTTYYYKITCEDNLNNQVVTLERSFKTNKKQTDHTLLTDATHDTELTIVTKTDTEALISFDAGTTADSKLCLSTSSGISVDSCEAILPEISDSRIHSYHLTGLSPQTAYYVKMKLTDTEVSSNTYTANEASFVTTAPQVEHAALSGTIHDTSPTVTMKTDTEAMITFNAGTNSSSKLCESATAGVDMENCTSKNSTTDTTLHTFHLTELTAATTYYVKMKVADSENDSDTFTSQEISFKTLEKQTNTSTSGTDITKPEISSVSVGSVTGESVTVTWNTNENTNSLVTYAQENSTFPLMAGDINVNKSTDNYVTEHSVTISSLTADIKYTFSILSLDVAGNIAQSAESSFTTQGASAISSIKVTSRAVGQANITWSTNASISSIVEYGLSTEYGKTKEDNTQTKDHEIILTELTPGETYHFRVKGKDAEGNMFASSDITFQPNAPPKISDFKIDSVYEHGATITLETNVLTDLVVVYIDPKNASNSGSQGQPELATKHEITLKNMASGVTYSVKVKVRDENGNETEEDFSTFTTTKDVNPPKIDNVHTDSALTQSDKVQTIITWKTDEQSTSSIVYREGAAGEEKEYKNSDTLSTNHVIVFTSFKPGTVYNFKVKSADASGNESISNYFSFLTPKQKQNIIQVIMGNFQDIFSWTGNVGK